MTTISNENQANEYRTTVRKLASIPGWQPESQPIPLPIKAVAATRAESRIPPAQFVVIGIKLHPFSIADDIVRWYYQIEYYDRRDAFGDKPPGTVDGGAAPGWLRRSCCPYRKQERELTTEEMRNGGPPLRPDSTPRRAAAVQADGGPENEPRTITVWLIFRPSFRLNAGLLRRPPASNRSAIFAISPLIVVPSLLSSFPLWLIIVVHSQRETACPRQP